MAFDQQRRAFALEDDEIALVCDVGGGTTDFSLIRVRIEAGAPAELRAAERDSVGSAVGADSVARAEPPMSSNPISA